MANLLPREKQYRGSASSCRGQHAPLDKPPHWRPPHDDSESLGGLRHALPRVSGSRAAGPHVEPRRVRRNLDVLSAKKQSRSDDRRGAESHDDWRRVRVHGPRRGNEATAQLRRRQAICGQLPQADDGFTVPPHDAESPRQRSARLPPAGTALRHSAFERCLSRLPGSG